MVCKKKNSISSQNQMLDISNLHRRFYALPNSGRSNTKMNKYHQAMLLKYNQIKEYLEIEEARYQFENRKVPIQVVEILKIIREK